LLLLGYEKRFHTAWVMSALRRGGPLLPVYPHEPTTGDAA
jgi:hypothetical protein